ncbi:helix-turn-helix transcriptional regulator [Flavobacterium buctense]|uniref:Helix-turn-helix transcriptional regulator n=1 Tax=Flavobacterium buctense TaxID=1648146 RepID=A0ABU9DZU9_9FLAO|nr:helix-turn-helix transcriptional regulator [Flavobacterium buctense]
MKLLDQIRNQLNENRVDIVFESQMVQSRIVSTFLEVIENNKVTQKELEERTGLSQPFLSAIFNNRKKLNVEHIAKLQNALNIILQPPKYLTTEEHYNTYYQDDEYVGLIERNFIISKEVCEFKFERLVLDNNRHSRKNFLHTKRIKLTRKESYEYA